MTLAHGEGRLVTRRTLILNRPPVAREAPMLALAGAGLEIPLTGALANDFDMDHDALTVGWVDSLSQTGGTVRLEGDRFIYTPPPGAPVEDQFGYALQDGRGGSSIGTVRLKFVGRVELRVESDDQGTDGVTVS
ncbi:MAG: Ig-like domain-containing protein, partial [Limisphaerales bacterium]